MEAKEFKEIYIDEDGEVDLPGAACVYVGATEVEYKYTTQESVYRVEEEYFKVVRNGMNTGYWSDYGESDTIEVYKVKPVEKVVIAYENCQY